MEFLPFFLVFTLGAIVGSFLNVVICRYHTGWRLVGGRSCCLACGEKLRWFELVPLLSFLVQSGRCRHCGSKISWQYPLVEVLSGLFLALVWRLGLPPLVTIFQWLMVSLLLVIAVYDFRHKIIPDGPIYLFLALTAVQMLWLDRSLYTLAAGVGLGVFFWLLWYGSSGRWMGLGDAKLALALGWWLGPTGALSAAAFAFWSGAAAGLLLLALRRTSFTMKSELPFAPFLVFGALINFFFNLNVVFF